MSLRARLILAFLLLSVVPLTAVTAQHYMSSLDTLHRVARRDAEQMTAELGQRMELVKSDLSQRVERLWADNRPLPAASDPTPTSGRDVETAISAAAMTGVAEALGETAMLLERLEFRTATVPETPEVASTPATAATPPTPATPAVPAATEPKAPAAPAAPAAPTAPATRARAAAAPAPGAVVIDMRELRDELSKAGVKVDDWSPEIEALIAKGVGFGTSVAAGGMKIGALAAMQQVAVEARREAAEEFRAKVADAARQGLPAPPAPPAPKPAPRAPRAEAAHAAFTRDGEGLDVTMERGGLPVGKVNAKLRLNRVLGTVVSNTRPENGEIAFAVDPKGTIITDNEADRAAIEALGIARSGETYHSEKGWLVVMRDDPAGSGARFGIARKIGDSVRDLRVSAGRDLATGLGVIGLALAFIFPVSGRLTKDLRKLHTGVDDLAHGNYAARVDVTSRDEIGRLATAFNQMAADIEAHQKLAVERESLKRELELCRQIQNDMLPHEPFRASFADVKGISIPAREVGGDFFNYFTMGDGDLAVLVGDVSGKGVSAALTMANVQATLKARLPVVPDLATLVDSIDREFEKTSPRGVYATLFAAVLDRRTRTLRYVNAGHHPQFVLRMTGGIVRLPSTGMPIGLFPGQGYVEQQIALSEGDLLFFYTDGTVETEDERGEMFGAERLEALLLDAHNDGVDAVLERAELAVRTFRGRAEPFDDATMMAMRVGRVGG